MMLNSSRLLSVITQIRNYSVSNPPNTKRTDNPPVAAVLIPDFYLMPSGSTRLLHPRLYRSSRLDTFDYGEWKVFGFGRLRRTAPVCQIDTAIFTLHGDRASKHGPSAKTEKDVRVYLLVCCFYIYIYIYSYDLLVNLLVLLQDEDAADHVSHLA